MSGKQVSCAWGGAKVEAIDEAWASGMASLGTGWNVGEFDDVEIVAAA